MKPKIRVVPITQLVLDENNANKGTKRGRELLNIVKLAHAGSKFWPVFDKEIQKEKAKIKQRKPPRFFSFESG